MYENIFKDKNMRPNTGPTKLEDLKPLLWWQPLWAGPIHENELQQLIVLTVEEKKKWLMMV